MYANFLKYLFRKLINFERKGNFKNSTKVNDCPIFVNVSVGLEMKADEGIIYKMYLC